MLMYPFIGGSAVTSFNDVDVSSKLPANVDFKASKIAHDVGGHLIISYWDWNNIYDEPVEKIRRRYGENIARWFCKAFYTRRHGILPIFDFPTAIGIRGTKVSNAKNFMEVPLKITKISEPSFLETRRFADPAGEQSENVYGGYRF